jgi:alpha-L-arabinofuranosidase
MIDMCNALGIQPIITTSMLSSAQDFADLVEYMYGNASTEWGAARYRDGHPAPYQATFFELGNEQYNPNYVEQVCGDLPVAACWQINLPCACVRKSGRCNGSEGCRVRNAKNVLLQ